MKPEIHVGGPDSSLPIWLGPVDVEDRLRLDEGVANVEPRSGSPRVLGIGVHLGVHNPRTVQHSSDHMDGKKATNCLSLLFVALFPEP